ncbi:MAG: EAL domain-containing protein, partial [Oscillospiraceae bacterium]|nr:EAL domain-containing protein [Oscillospiraceae bacterium]
YYMMAYEDFTATSCPSTGIFEELIIHGASSMHADDQQIFAQTFNRKNLLKAYANGESKIRLVTRQLGDDGQYRPVETTDYFIKTSSSDDVLVITLCENLPLEN